MCRRKKVVLLEDVCGREGCNTRIPKNRRYCRKCLIEKFKIKSDLQKQYKKSNAIILRTLRIKGFTKEFDKQYIKNIRREEDIW